MALLVLVLLLLVVLTAGSLRVGEMDDERPGQVDVPTFEEVSEVDESAGDEENAPEEKEDAPEEKEDAPEEKEDAPEEKEELVAAAPDDPTLFLTVPKLGLYSHTVRNDDSEQALDVGAIKVPGTDFPWQEGDKNTYIACHRLGWPGTESHNQCLNLPSIREGDEVFLKDTNGMVYEYRVSETLTVGPGDSWVMKPLTGKDVVSLQTCIEAPGDFLTLGPNWLARFVVRAERI